MRIRYLAWTFSLILLVTGAARGDTVDPPQPPDLCAPLDATGVQGIDTAVPGGKLILHATGLADEYIVVLKKAPRQAKAGTQAANLDSSGLPQPVESLARELTGTYGGHYRSIYEHALRGFSAALTLDQARAIAADERVKFIEQVTPIHAPVVQTQAPSPGFPVPEYFPQLNTLASAGGDPPVTGANVHFFLIDTGLYRGLGEQHSEFAGRVAPDPAEHFDVFSTSIYPLWDCDPNGHGTHVAGIAVGKTFGMAPGAQLHIVRVFSWCPGPAGGSTSTIADGVNWVAAWKKAHTDKSAVANISLDNNDMVDYALNEAVAGLSDLNVPVVVAAGNGLRDTQNHYTNQPIDANCTSPASEPKAITVSAVDRQNRWGSTVDLGDCFRDGGFPNYGSAVDVFALGQGVYSAGIASPTATKCLSGTSMAAPQVAGVVAQYLEVFPDTSMEVPKSMEVRDAIVNNATSGLIQATSGFAFLPPGTPNLVLEKSFVVRLASISVNPSSVTAGQSTTGTVALSGPAPKEGATVTLSSNSIRTSVPTSVFIPYGIVSTPFTISTSPFIGSTTVNITGTYGSTTAVGSFTLQGFAPRVVDWRCATPTGAACLNVGGGTSLTLSVDLSDPAPAGGMLVNLSSSNPGVLAVPSSVLVSQGTTSTMFTAVTNAVTTPTPVTLTASTSAGTASLTITVLPPIFEGYLDLADCNNISGWAWDQYQPNTPIYVDILYDGGGVIARNVLARVYRPDLVAAGKGNAAHGFGFPTPTFLYDGRAHDISVYYSGSVPYTQVTSSPRSIACAGPSVSIAWILPAELEWGPPGTLTAAGYAQNGTGGVSMWWRDVTVNGPWNPVAWAPVPDRGQWSNTIPNTDNCHVYQVWVTYSGANASATYNGDYCLRTIQVLGGTYGNNCGAYYRNATWSLSSRCSGQTSCSYTIDYRILGDPAPGCAKDFWAEWACGSDTTSRWAYAPPEAGFGSVVTLQCP